MLLLGMLFAFFPTENAPHSSVEKRQRSVSPPGERRHRRRRRRLFESFGVIPSLQMRYRSHELEAEDDALEEDSDPVLNIPSLLLGRRVQALQLVMFEHADWLRYSVGRAGTSPNRTTERHSIRSDQGSAELSTRESTLGT